MSTGRCSVVNRRSRTHTPHSRDGFPGARCVAPIVTRERPDAARAADTSVSFRPFETVFAQGDRSGGVMYIRKGRVKISVRSRDGREAVVAILRAGAFFGEGALAGQQRRRSTARTITAATIAVMKTAVMRRRLHEETALADRFLSHLLGRNIRIEADLVGQIFNRCEKRLARILLLLANFDEHQLTRAVLPVISRDLLAELVGTS